MEKVNIYVDGACKGNGSENVTGSYGTYAVEHKGEILKLVSSELQALTNNQAEWGALLEALRYVKYLREVNKKELDIHIYMDSKLIVNQYNGQYKIKNEALRELFNASQEYPRENLSWVPREIIVSKVGH